MATNKIIVEFDAQKLSALKKFAEKKNVNIEEELSFCLDKIYKKVVPLNVREFIES